MKFHNTLAGLGFFALAVALYLSIPGIRVTKIEQPEGDILSSFSYVDDPSFNVTNDKLLIKHITIGDHSYLYMKDANNHMEVFTKEK